MQHNSLYKLTKEWLGDKRLKIKQGSLKKTKLDVSVIAVSKNLTRFQLENPGMHEIFTQLYSMKLVPGDLQNETHN